MKSRFSILVASTFIVSVSGSLALAQTETVERPYSLIRSMPKFIEAYLSQLMLPFRAAAGDDQVLTRDDVSKQQLLVDARQRANLLQTFFAADLDGDMTVTSEEWRTISENNDFRAASFIGWDTDKNGVVTVGEVYAFSKTTLSGLQNLRQSFPLAALLELDSAKDGALTAAELEHEGRGAFAQYDVDGNGMLSPVEMTTLKRDQTKGAQVSNQQLQFAVCDVPRPEKDQRVLFVSGYEGVALSNVTVAGQDAQTDTAEIRIEPGDEPLFIIVTTYTPMVWRVTGAVNRVARLVATSQIGGAGVTGLPQERIVLPPRGQCLSRLPDAEDAGRASLRGLGLAMGKSVDGAYSAYSLSTITLPSQAVPPESWRHDKTRRTPEFSWGPLRPAENTATAAMKRFKPGGIVEIELSDVIATSKAERYEVLPQEAGLAQLIETGAIRYDPMMGYVIQRPIPRFPAKLSGAHLVRFVLADGVPRPLGDPGHSAVVTFEEAQKRLVPLSSPQFQRGGGYRQQ